jgi:transposase-like protein
MSPPYRQSVAQISAELGIHVITLYNWRKAWQSQRQLGEGVAIAGRGQEVQRKCGKRKEEQAVHLG